MRAEINPDEQEQDDEPAFIDRTAPDYPDRPLDLRNRPVVDVFHAEYLEAAEQYILDTYPDTIGIVRAFCQDKILLRGQYHAADRWVGVLFVIHPDDA